MARLTLYQMAQFYVPRKGKKMTCFQELIELYEKSGDSFLSFLMSVGSEYMLACVRELSVVSL